MESEVDTPVVTTSEQHSENSPVQVKHNIFLRTMSWVFKGKSGLRAGWSIGLFVLFMGLWIYLITFIAKQAHLMAGGKFAFTAVNDLIVESIGIVMLVSSAALVALIERRRLRDYNLAGPNRLRHFFTGWLGGFAAVSLLMGGLYLGGWLHVGALALSGISIWKYAALWGLAFLAVGCLEEGMFRCFLQYTLTRGLNFWWALGILAVVCADLIFTGKGNGIWGVYFIGGLGLIPCLIVHLRKLQSSGFWQAAWVTSTLFGFVHTNNGGESWVGIFQAAAIGFVFCVTIKLTGSVWWAIGFHAAWDWGLTYFYGAADSGNPAVGHFLSTNPVGGELWSGGATGPEGSLLTIPLLVLILVAIVFVYGRKKSEASAVAAELPAS
jgi:uncharacterized protein